ncbi:MAG: HAMP domain-containing histidine kinase [Lachnospiraceae bacterium]|nr:HAMP domain-containing histidine kinase [Lachnospiraceae bacterium]
MKYLIVLCLILLAVSAALAVKLLRQRRQLRLFTQQLKEIREEKQNRLIRVDQFDECTIELAKELQAYVEEEQQLLKKAGEERRAVQTMVAGISHDFRTPLTAAAGYMQIVAQDRGLSERSSDYLEKAIAKTTYLKDLSDEFFALSLVDSKGKEEAVKLSVKRLLEEVTLSQYEWIEAAGIGFSADITEESCDYFASEVDILRMLENLYSNARKYAKSRIHVRLVKPEGKGFVLSMSNDSDRLGAEDIEDIFKPFHRSSSGDTPGSGLGLYVVKRIAEKYGCGINAGLSEDGDFAIQIAF